MWHEWSGCCCTICENIRYNYWIRYHKWAKIWKTFIRIPHDIFELLINVVLTKFRNDIDNVALVFDLLKVLIKDKENEHDMCDMYLNQNISIQLLMLQNHGLMNLQNNHEMQHKKLSKRQQLRQQHLVQYSDINSPEYSNKPIIINSNATSISTSYDATSGDKGRDVQVTSMIRLPSVPDDEEDTKG